MVEQNQERNQTGERLARLEVQSMNLERAVDRVDKKVDHLDTKMDGIESQISGIKLDVARVVAEQVGGFKVFVFLWGVLVTVISVAAPYVAHVLGVTK